MTIERTWPQERTSIPCPQDRTVLVVVGNELICPTCKYQDFSEKDTLINSMIKAVKKQKKDVQS